MPAAGGEQTYCYAAILQDWLIPVVAAKDGAAFGGGEAEVQKALAQRYWGVVQDFLPLLSGTAFDGRTVGFSDGQALYEAFEKGEVGGMLTGQENYDALLLCLHSLCPKKAIALKRKPRHLHYKQKKICYLSVFPILITKGIKRVESGGRGVWICAGGT